jgi:hypothetical protein
MRAIVIERFGGPDCLVYTDLPEPEPLDGHALIEQADPDLLKMLLVCGGGRSVVDQGGQQACLSAAEFAFYDTRRPYEVTCGIERDRPTRVLTFMFSRPVTAVPEPAQAAECRTHPGHRRRGRAGLAVPPAAGRQRRSLQPGEAARLSTAALEVLATRLAHELDVAGPPRAYALAAWCACTKPIWPTCGLRHRSADDRGMGPRSPALGMTNPVRRAPRYAAPGGVRRRG